MKSKKLLLSISFSMILLSFSFVSCSGDKKDAGKADTESVAPAASEAASPVETVVPDSLSGTLPTVIDFNATWCGPCRMMAPEFTRLAREYEGKVRFLSIDVDRNPDLADKYDIQSIPAFIFLDPSGREVNRIVGADVDGLNAAVKALAK